MAHILVMWELLTTRVSYTVSRDQARLAPGAAG